MNKTIQRITMVGVFISLSAGLKAQQSPMNLKSCIDYALENSPTLSIYANQVMIAKHQNKEGLSGYLPQVNASFSVDDNLKRQTTIIPAGAFSPEPLQVQFGNQYAGTASAQLDQVIYDQTLINSLRASNVNVELAELNQEQNENTVIYNTATAYYNVLILQEQLTLIQENEEKVANLVEVQQLQYDKGVLQESALNRIKVNLNNIISQREQVQLNLAMSIENLKNVIGMDPNSSLTVESDIDLNEVKVPESVPFVVSNKIDYQILETNIQLQEIDLKRKRSQYLPTISGYARYGANAFGNEFRTTFNDWYDFSSIGLKVNIPIFSGMRRFNQVKQSEFNLDITRQQLDLNSRIFELEQKNAETKLNSSYLMLKSNKLNLDLAEEVYEMTQVQYQGGTATLSDFLNADYARKEAQSNYFNSMLNYYVAQIEIEKSKGSLKEFYNNL